MTPLIEKFIKFRKDIINDIIFILSNEEKIVFEQPIKIKGFDEELSSVYLKTIKQLNYYKNEVFVEYEYFVLNDFEKHEYIDEISMFSMDELFEIINKIK